MNRSDLIANEVVKKYISRMVVQEREELESSLQDFWSLCPFTDKEQMLEVVLHVYVMAKISVLARFN